MTFLRPDALWWAFLAVPLVILYLRRDRIPRRVASAISLWQRVLADRTLRARWLRWRRPVSLAVHFAVLIALVLAMAEPEGTRSGGDSWWTYLALGAVAVLIIEWRWYQRRWTC